jgi:dolichyl-phosphate beta-glucosyltransferase
VTLLAGPQVSLTLVLTLGYAGSAASMYWVLRQWGASILAAALGGAVYGFSPALIDSGLGHYHLAFAVLPPLIIHALLRIVAGRGSAIRNGAWLGLLTAAQVFIGEELLVDTGLAGLLLVAVLAAQRPRTALRRARGAAVGLATAAAVLVLIAGHALWVQIAGPLHEHSILLGSFGGDLASFVVPPGQLLLHTPASAAAANSFQPGGAAEYLGYLGVPLLAVLLAAMIRFWRDPKVAAAAVTFVVLELCAAGGATLTRGRFRYPGYLLPWHWVQGLPGLAQVLPNRFSILADGAAAALLAFSLDRARSAAPQAQGWRRSAPTAVAVLAILPLLPLPFQTAPLTPVPAGWQAAFRRLGLTSDARVLVVPIPILRCTPAMRWQADTGEPRSLIGGYFLGPGSGGQATFSPGPTTIVARYLDRLWVGGSASGSSSTALVRSDLAYVRPAAVVAVTSADSVLGQFLTRILGPPAFQVADVLVWRL